MQPSFRDPSAAEVFISYRTSETSADAQLLFRLLEERDLDVFLDAADIDAGEDWNDKIQQALRSPQLAVGVVLMSTAWFENYLGSDEPNDPQRQRWHALAGQDEKPGIVLWEEVCHLQSRPELRLMPVVVRTDEDDEGTPRLPAATSPGFAELKELDEDFKRRQYTKVPPKVLHRFDHLVDKVCDAVRQHVLRTPLKRTWTFAAKDTPPQALSLVHPDTRLRRRWQHYVDMESHYRHDHELETLRGQEALLRCDFPAAIGHLGGARSKARTDPRQGAGELDPGGAFRAQLWHAHALNLFVVASLRGGRPRRRQITEASALLRDALLMAIEVEVDLTDWPRGPTDQDDADRRSTAYVVETTLLLLWLLWKDFFLARNVRFPERTTADVPRVEKRLDQVRTLLYDLERVGVPRTAADADRLFLVTGGYLDGLPPDLSDTGAWALARGTGDVDKLLTSLEA